MALVTGVDPITKAVVQGALTTAAREMRDTIQRTSLSTVIYEDRDFACGILDAEAGTIAEAPGHTFFMGTLSPGVEKCLEVIPLDAIESGDVIVTTMPEFTGMHPADVMLFSPIFHGDSIFGFSASKAHLVDLGAKDPYPTDSIDAFQEGLRIPPTKLYRRGELNAEISAIMLANSRAPDVIWGDIQALINSSRIGRLAILRLIEKYGREAIQASIRELYVHAERSARAAIRRMRAGTWMAEDYLDDNGVERGKPVKIAVAVTIDPDAAEVTFDYTGSGAQQVGPTNCPFISTVSVSRMMGKILTSPDTPANEGAFRPFNVIAPEATIFNPTSTAPTNLYAWPAFNAIEAVCRALSVDFPERFPACSGGDLCGVFRYGYLKSGKIWLEANIEGIGQGASARADGESAVVHISEACSRNLPVEIEETRDPIFVERYELIQDSGGAGRFRGGLGVRRDYRFLAPGHMISILEHCTSPHFGIAGGKNGGRTYGVLESAIHGNIEITKTPAIPMAADDLLSVRTGGGGGFGDPLERDRDAVVQDVINGYVSHDAARSVYGVVVDPTKLVF